MKIQHLLEYQFPKIARVEIPHNKHPRRDNSRIADFEIGRGNFSKAFHNPEKAPHDVRKVSSRKSRSSIDGFYHYIIALEDNPDNSNPYFPRFRDIKIYTDTHQEEPAGDADDPTVSQYPVPQDKRRDEITYSANMEKLNDLLDITKEEEDALLIRIFGDNIGKGYNNGLVDDLAQMEPHQLPSWPGARVLSIIKIMTIEQHAEVLGQYIVDADLNNAMAWLRNQENLSNIWFDLHKENVMIRRTPYGAQLVITDPFSFQR